MLQGRSENRPCIGGTLLQQFLQSFALIPVFTKTQARAADFSEYSGFFHPSVPGNRILINSFSLLYGKETRIASFGIFIAEFQ
jgi:hypothetical protein